MLVTGIVLAPAMVHVDVGTLADSAYRDDRVDGDATAPMPTFMALRR